MEDEMLKKKMIKKECLNEFYLSLNLNKI